MKKELKQVPPEVLHEFIKECCKPDMRDIIILMYITDCLRSSGYKL